jgi:Sodium/hydrogen exchanger family
LARGRDPSCPVGVYHSNDIEHWCWRVSGPDSVVHVQAHSTLSCPSIPSSRPLCSFAFVIFAIQYSIAESMELSGIMAIFFQGIILSHYNSYNLSPAAHVASEQIFSTLATIIETAVFLYMGMGVFTGRFANLDILFSVLALSFCNLGRILNIFPLPIIANICRKKRSDRITCKMQGVLYFAGLRPGCDCICTFRKHAGPQQRCVRHCDIVHLHLHDNRMRWTDG